MRLKCLFFSLIVFTLIDRPIIVAQQTPVPCASPAAKDGLFCDSLKEALEAAKNKTATSAALQASPGTATLQDADQKASTRLDDAIRDLTEPTSTDTFIAAGGSTFSSALEQNLVSKDSAFNNAVDAWEKQRLDVQQGANPNAAGSTNLVVKSGVAALFSTAYQLGAFTQTVTGDTATFRINGGRFIKAISHGSPVASPDESEIDSLIQKKTENLNNHHFDFNNLEIAVGVDLNQQGTQTVSTSGSANGTTPDPGMIQLPAPGSKLSSITARYAVVAPFDPGSDKFKQAFAKSYNAKRDDLKKRGELLASAVEQLLLSFPPAKYKTLRDQFRPVFVKDANDQDGDKLEKDFQQYFDQVMLVVAQDSSLQAKIAAAKISLASFQDLVNDVVNDARGGSPFTLEYDYNRPANQPDTHVVRGIFAHQYNQALFSFNGALTIYGDMSASNSKYHRVRDFQFSAGFDTPIGDPRTSIFGFSAAGYLQYQQDPSVLNIQSGNLVPGTPITLPSDAQVLLGTSGLLAIGQAKFTINTKTGITVPLAFKISNKTDLLDSMDVRGQFGISYDFSSFTHLFGAKN